MTLFCICIFDCITERMPGCRTRCIAVKLNEVELASMASSILSVKNRRCGAVGCKVSTRSVKQINKSKQSCKMSNCGVVESSPSLNGVNACHSLARLICPLL